MTEWQVLGIKMNVRGPTFKEFKIQWGKGEYTVCKQCGKFYDRPKQRHRILVERCLLWWGVFRIPGKRWLTELIPEALIGVKKLLVTTKESHSIEWKTCYGTCLLHPVIFLVIYDNCNYIIVHIYLFNVFFLAELQILWKQGPCQWYSWLYSQHLASA